MGKEFDKEQSCKAFMKEIDSVTDPEELIWLYGQKKISERYLRSKLSIWDQKAHASLIKAAKDTRNTISVHDRDTQVIYITGPSGSGKTNTLARYIAKVAAHDDYSVGAAGDHMVESYNDSECFIIDDFRGQMRFNELLNFLDNKMNVEANARYTNKDFSNCKLIIITSIVTPDSLYKSDAIMDEPIKQLYRRLGNRKADGTTDATYIRIGSRKGNSFSCEAAPSIPEGYYAFFRCEDNTMVKEYGVKSMRKPYEETYIDSSGESIAKLLGFDIEC